MRGDKTYIRKGSEKSNDILQRDIALTRIAMTYRFTTMREDQQVIIAHNLHQGYQQRNIAQPVTLTMWHQLAQTDHTRFRAALQFMNCSRSCCWLQHRHTIYTSRVALHSLDNIAIRFFYQARISPAKRKSNRDIHARVIHLTYQVLSARQAHTRITV